MERKLWWKVSALLLLLALSALASHDDETSTHGSVAPEAPSGPGPTWAPGTPTPGPGSESSFNESGQVKGSNNNTETGQRGGLNNITEEKPTPLIPLNSSDETTVTNSPVIHDINGTTAQSQLTTASTTLSTTNKTETSPAPLPTLPAHLENMNTSQSDAPMQNSSITLTTPLSPSTSTPATATTTTTTTTTTIAITTSTTTASTVASSTTTTTKEKTAITHSEVLSDPDTHKGVTPSQLNVGEETTATHDSPTLDPLLAGLVSAFIIAAVIITLLLFLKLRRRDNRPEFRRLQDLPMDDMMEDTPLSMYSY